MSIPPFCSWYPPMYWTPRCTHDIPPTWIMRPPTCIMVSILCAEHPPMYSWYTSTCIMVSLGGCSVHRRLTMITSGDVQYIGGIRNACGRISWVYQGDIMSTSGMFITSEGYHDACVSISWVHWGCSVRRRDTVMHVGGYHEYIGRIYEYIRGCSAHQGFQYKSKAFINLFPHINHNTPRFTHGIPPMYWTSPMYSWYPPHESWYPSDVLNIPRCTQDIPTMYTWYPPAVLNIPRFTEHTLYRVIIALKETLTVILIKIDFEFCN